MKIFFGNLAKHLISSSFLFLAFGRPFALEEEPNYSGEKWSDENQDNIGGADKMQTTCQSGSEYQPSENDWPENEKRYGYR